jgi:hypothetical protein
VFEAAPLVMSWTAFFAAARAANSSARLLSAVSCSCIYLHRAVGQGYLIVNKYN